MELYKKYRPKQLKEVVGQNDVLRSLYTMYKKKKLPHALLFTGPSGCGKTTIARIIANLLGCGSHDFHELNTADFRGVDMVRNIRSQMTLSPISGSCQIYLIDECHKLTNDAQNAFLKILEDYPSHVYFFLCTTDPQKLLKTIRTRCTEIAVKSLSDEAMTKLLKSVCLKERKRISDEVIEKIVENSEGSARQALVNLHAIIDLDKEKDMLEAIQKSSVKIQAFEIARALSNPKTTWSTMSKILREVDTEEAESIRWMVLSYAKSAILNNRNVGQNYLVLDSFGDNFFDSKAAGLVRACYEVIAAK